MRVLVVDHAHSEVCGIHDLGRRITRCLAASDKLDVTHVDAGNPATYRGAVDAVDPDAIIVNYRPDLMPWILTVLNEPRAAVVYAVLHQYEEATADARARAILADGFNYVLALDPELVPTEPRLLAVGRPILPSVEHDGQSSVPAVVGSFGFAFPHKGFGEVAAEIADQCAEGVFALHMPEAFFNGANGAQLYTAGILADVEAKVSNLWFTNDHCDENQLVERLAANDVNCLFYVPGQPDAGLSSAVDYLIAARRPMLVTDCAMFRHARNTPRYPAVRLGDILSNYDKYQQLADELYERHAGRFVNDIEQLLEQQ